MLFCVVVLIYPYWNVNVGKEGTSITASMVLIYPYWNVNDIFVEKPEFRASFNLSILECKCRSKKQLLVRVQIVLIYPYWNVNKLLTAR